MGVEEAFLLCLLTLSTSALQVQIAESSEEFVTEEACWQNEKAIYTCEDGTCFHKNFTCNGNADCKNGEDESVALCGCLPNEFACSRNGSCVAMIRRCDGHKDCPDSEDEENCDTYICPESHMKCLNHFCIQKELVCNFKEDCSDGSDELGCSYRECWYGEFRCDNGECIPPGLVCDGQMDCLDASDETKCLIETCGDGRPIHKSYRCNGWPDCSENHEDELNCECNKTQYKCSNGRCLPNSHKCDGECDCLYSCDDEFSCQEFYTTINGHKICNVGATIACSSTVQGQIVERCIAAEYICDGYNDCHTGRHESIDELGCHLQDDEVPLLNGYSCLHPDSRILPLSSRCDHKIDCLHGDDETNCTHYAERIDGRYLCANGQIVDKPGVHCDITVDCHDKSDETSCTNFVCPGTNEFLQPNGSVLEIPLRQCNNGQCLREDFWCDYIVDCADASDEETCDKRGICAEGEFKCRTLQQCISNDLVCFDNGDPRSGCADRSHLQGCKDVECPVGTAKCRNGPCINASLICDNNIDCKDVWSDEENCTYICHEGCTCIDTTLNCTGLGLREVPRNIQDPFNKIYFADNQLANTITEDAFIELYGVIELDLTNNHISILEPGCFRRLSQLRILTLRNNKIRNIQSDTFDGLSLLTQLHLDGNGITRIETKGFYGLSSLTTLKLRSQHICNISKGAFIGLSNLNKLDLSFNRISYLKEGALIGLNQIKSLDLSHNPLASVHSHVFRSVHTLERLYFDEFRFCCYAKRVKTCLPTPDEFSSCEDLMSNVVLRICIWLLGIIATFGNLFVIIWRLKFKHSNRVHSFLITNLAIGDLFMGCYLLVIALIDLKYRGEYSVYDKAWRTSRLCSFAGFLSTFSSELSVFTLTVITLDRFLAILFPFRFTRLEMRQTFWVMCTVWVVAAFLSGLPLVDIEYFNGFYGRSGVCLALHITPEKHNGWEYSVFVFLAIVCTTMNGEARNKSLAVRRQTDSRQAESEMAKENDAIVMAVFIYLFVIYVLLPVLNLISFSIIAFGYITMYGEARNTSLAVGRQSDSRRAESAMAKRMTLIVATDAACWVPIILLGILSLSGTTVPKQVFAWVAVFILPLNAAINPILYTISTAAFLAPATRNFRQFNRSFTFSRGDHLSRRTISTNMGSSFTSHNHRGMSQKKNDIEMNNVETKRHQKRRSFSNKSNVDQHNRQQLDGEHEEDDSDYESESFADQNKGGLVKGDEFKGIDACYSQSNDRGRRKNER